MVFFLVFQDHWMDVHDFIVSSFFEFLEWREGFSFPTFFLGHCIAKYLFFGFFACNVIDGLQKRSKKA